MKLPDLREMNLSAVVVAGSMIGRSTTIRSTGNVLPEAKGSESFQVFPSRDHHGRLGLKVARLLHQAKVRTKLLASWNLLRHEGRSLPRDLCQSFFTQDALVELLPATLEEQKPDLVFLTQQTPNFQVWRFVDDSERFSLESDKGPSLLEIVRPHLPESACVIQLGAPDVCTEESLSRAAVDHVVRAYAEYSLVNEGQRFGLSGVIASFGNEDEPEVLKLPEFIVNA